VASAAEDSTVFQREYCLHWISGRGFQEFYQTCAPKVSCWAVDKQAETQKTSTKPLPLSH
jgi:hypothetical protein